MKTIWEWLIEIALVAVIVIVMANISFYTMRIEDTHQKNETYIVLVGICVLYKVWTLFTAAMRQRKINKRKG